MGEEKSFFNTFTLAILIIILVGLVYILTTPEPENAMVHFLDVGQGDAALIETPFNQRILIDGGPNNTVVSKLDKIIPFYQKRIDAVILTHPHADHLDGLLSLLKTYQVKTVYLTGIIHTTPEYIEFLDVLKAKNITTKNIYFNQEIKLDGGIVINFLYPIENMAGLKVENINNSSIVARLVWEKESFLFLGDLENEGQQDLLKTNQVLKSDVLKIAHHGSKDGANEELVKNVNPRFAVIPVGIDNKFGHPSPKILDLLASVKIFRTDREGDIRCEFNQSFLSCEPKLVN